MFCATIIWEDFFSFAKIFVESVG